MCRTKRIFQCYSDCVGLLMAQAHSWSSISTVMLRVSLQYKFCPAYIKIQVYWRLWLSGDITAICSRCYVWKDIASWQRLVKWKSTMDFFIAKLAIDILRSIAHDTVSDLFDKISFYKPIWITAMSFRQTETASRWKVQLHIGITCRTQLLQVSEDKIRLDFQP